MSPLQWLLHTDAGLFTRIGIGALIFLILASVDLVRHGRQARRWREYVFLFSAVVIAMVYGVVNDQITSRISWEYYYYFKELAPVLGTRTPPEAGALSWEAAKVGLKATWTVGLIIGVAMLLANNPRRGRLQLSISQLLARMPWVLWCALIGAMGLGIAGYFGWLAVMSDDFREMLRRDEFRPHRFMTVYGIHLGGYLGGAVGMMLAVLSIVRGRRAMLKDARFHQARAEMVGAADRRVPIVPAPRDP